MYQDTFADRNQEATVWVGNLDSEVDEELLVELMLQAGPVMSVNMPRDKVTGTHQGFAFVEYRSEEDANYAMKILNMIRLIGKTLKINKATREQGEQDIGANLFVGNLDPDVDEQLLYTTFSAFGQVVAAKVMYDETDGASKGFGFVNFSDFNSADNALKNMNGQFLCNRAITVSFAYKKGETGSNAQKHGSLEERRLANLAGAIPTKVNTKFASELPNQFLQKEGLRPFPIHAPAATPMPMPLQMPAGMMMPAPSMMGMAAPPRMMGPPPGVFPMMGAPGGMQNQQKIPPGFGGFPGGPGGPAAFPPMPPPGGIPFPGQAPFAGGQNQPK